ncbi:MAG TPA: hypothetical protein VKU01_23905 [Bryobacteraceae bacterium]|nr:hypothetical protein [Bryobacteraceae bacterium]
MDPKATAAALRELQRQLGEIQEQLAGTPQPKPNEIVQLKPDAHPNFGGAVFRITKTTPAELTGYLLVPHRSGVPMRMARAHVVPVGTLCWPEPLWSCSLYGEIPLLLTSLLSIPATGPELARALCAPEIALFKQQHGSSGAFLPSATRTETRGARSTATSVSIRKPPSSAAAHDRRLLELLEALDESGT